MESAVFMGKNYQNNLWLHCEYDRSHTQTNVRHIYEIGVWARWDLRIGNNWLGESFMEISVVNWWGKNHQSSAHEGLRLFGFCVVPWEDFLENPESDEAWEQRLGWIKSSQNYRNFDRIDGEPMEFECNIFPGFDTLQLCGKVKSLLLRLGETPETFTGRILFMSMFNDISCLIRAKRDQDRITFGLWWPCSQRSSIAHWRSLAISCSGLSWIHVHNRKAGSKETPKLGPYWKLQPVICTVNMELRSELSLWAETTLTPGSEFLKDQIRLWWIWTTTKQKFPKINSKNLR